MTDPRTLFMQPAGRPLFGEAAKAVGQALRHPVDQPLFGETARAVGLALRDLPRR